MAQIPRHSIRKKQPTKEAIKMNTRLVHRPHLRLNPGSAWHVQKLGRESESIWNIVIRTWPHTVQEEGVIRLSTIN